MLGLGYPKKKPVVEHKMNLTVFLPPSSWNGISSFEKYPKEYQKALKPVNHGLTENQLKPWPHPYR